LGFAERTSHVKFTVKHRKSKLFKPFQTNIQIIGDAICANRQAKNLTPGQVAARMGIAAALVLAWEDGSVMPNERQLEYLARILGFDPRACELQATAR
jgi:DNA-binding transcriptional regulator YiaG